MLFDIIAKFETKILVKPFDKGFEDLLNACNYSNTALPHSIHTLEHNVNISNSPIIPNDEWIESTKKIIFDGVKKSLVGNEKINAEPTETIFIGFTKVSQHK